MRVDTFERRSGLAALGAAMIAAVFACLGGGDGSFGANTDFATGTNPFVVIR